jgi:alkanesulfonate monooxygenase SsuD/methylene tetrahydromethanopterin reductase-like flavin-dependent oxidoreductase (luciferase family)
VIPLMARDPLSLAKQAATLDLLSGGRLELGVGAGWCWEEAGLLGHPADHPVGRLAEAIEIMRRAWSEESFSYDGRFWQLPELGVHPQPPQGAGLTVWVGGTSNGSLRVAAEQGDGTLVSRNDLSRVAEVRGRLPAGKRVGALMTLTGTDADGELAQRIRDDGADFLCVMLDGGGAPLAKDSARASAERFAERVLPKL